MCSTPCFARSFEMCGNFRPMSGFPYASDSRKTRPKPSEIEQVTKWVACEIHDSNDASELVVGAMRSTTAKSTGRWFAAQKCFQRSWIASHCGFSGASVIAVRVPVGASWVRRISSPMFFRRMPRAGQSNKGAVFSVSDVRRGIESASKTGFGNKCALVAESPALMKWLRSRELTNA